MAVTLVVSRNYLCPQAFITIGRTIKKKFVWEYGPLKGGVASKWVKMSYFLLAKRYLKGMVDHMSKDYEPASTGTTPKGGYACIISIHLFTLSKL